MQLLLSVMFISYSLCSSQWGGYMGPPRVPTYYNFSWVPHTFGGVWPSLISHNVSNRYLWYVLRSRGSTCSRSVSTGRYSTTGNSLHLFNALPSVPENPRGPLVAPSTDWNRCRSGSSFAWSKHTSHRKGRFTSSRQEFKRAYHATCSSGIRGSQPTMVSSLRSVLPTSTVSSLQRCSCWSHPLALHGNISSQLGEPRNFLQIVYILHMFITGIVTSFLHYAELIVKNDMLHSTLIYTQYNIVSVLFRQIGNACRD